MGRELKVDVDGMSYETLISRIAMCKNSYESYIRFYNYRAGDGKEYLDNAFYYLRYQTLFMIEKIIRDHGK